jgi:hypothetical protein
MARGTNRNQHPKNNTVNVEVNKRPPPIGDAVAPGLLREGAGNANLFVESDRRLPRARSKLVDAASLGELKYLESVDKNKLSDIYSFPLDLQNSNLPYLIFYVYDTVTEPVSGAYNNRDASLKTGAGELINVTGYVAQQVNELTAGAAGALTETGISVLDKIGQAAGFTDTANGFSSTLKTRFAGFSSQRNTNLLQKAIVLYMPDTLQAEYAHNYDEISVTATLGAAGMLAQAIFDTKGGAQNAIDPYILEAASSVAGALPGLQSSQELTNLLLFGTTGRAVNPQMEVLYNSPRLRTFTFEFTLIPRNKIEAERIKEIITMFKFYSAPFIEAKTSGRYYIPPARFVMEFHHKGNENPYLFKTKQCVLENITLNYSPNGYASHYDGAPVATYVQLMFKETTMISRNDISLSGASY